MTEGLCAPWVTAAQVRGCSPCTATNPAAGYDLASAIDTASQLLYLLSGAQWPGSCTRTIRPCPSECGGCCCCWAPTIVLHDDVTAITSVWQDGVLVPSTEYRLDEGRYLVRLADADGISRWWRTCQRLDLPRTAVDTLEITYTWGRAPPRSGVQAAAALACQVALACLGSTECQLPQRIQTLVSQGVSMTLGDTFDFFREGKLGVYAIDSFLAAVNPNRLLSAPSVVSPDYKPHRRTG